MDKEIKKIIKELSDLGWKVRENKHYVCTSPSGFTLTISKTPSCQFAIKKIKRDIEKAK